MIASLQCQYCLSTWTPPPRSEREICRFTKSAEHGRHIICVACWRILRKLRRHEELAPEDAERIRRSPDLLVKLRREDLLPKSGEAGS